MNKTKSISEHIVFFNNEVLQEPLDLPVGYELVNPFNGDKKDIVNAIVDAFYSKFYHDTKPRRLILGSSPARRGSAATGIPFEDAEHLQKETGIFIDDFYINKASSSFLYDVIHAYGGCGKFYSDFYMNFVCPLGIVKTNTKGKKVNCNYYENKLLKEVLYPFIIHSIQTQINFGLDTSVCYCIGSGENYKFLSSVNKKYEFFDNIIPLEHPRYIMQYNTKNKDIFLKKYLDALCINN